MEGYEKHEFPAGMLDPVPETYFPGIQVMRELAEITPRSTGTEYYGFSRGVAAVRKVDDIRTAAEAWETATAPTP